MPTIEDIVSATEPMRERLHARMAANPRPMMGLETLVVADALEFVRGPDGVWAVPLEDAHDRA